MAKGPGFVHLHVHSSFSLLEGALQIGKLVDRAKADKMLALALTDTNNLFGALEFSEKMSGYGIQPIIGIELVVDFADRPVSRNRPNSALESRGSLVLLAADAAGYSNLMALSSRAFMDSPAAEGIHLPLRALEGRTAGLIAMTGGGIGPIDRAFGMQMYSWDEVRKNKHAGLKSLAKRLLPNTILIQRLPVVLQIQDGTIVVKNFKRSRNGIQYGVAVRGPMECPPNEYRITYPIWQDT